MQPNHTLLTLKNPLIRLGIAVALLLIFYFFYKLILIPEKDFIRGYTKVLAIASAGLIELLGYKSQIYNDGINTSFFIYINNRASVSIAYPCIGFNLLAVYSVFHFMFFGKTSKKILYWLMGCAIIYLTNIIRIVALAVNYYHDPVSMEFNHKYTYNIIIYGIIFSLWFFWLKNNKQTALIKPDEA